MLKLIQIIRYMTKQGKTLDEILAELTEIIDNGNSQYFELSGQDINGIAVAFQDDDKFDAAWQIAVKE